MMMLKNEGLIRQELSVLKGQSTPSPPTPERDRAIRLAELMLDELRSLSDRLAKIESKQRR